MQEPLTQLPSTTQAPASQALPSSRIEATHLPSSQRGDQHAPEPIQASHSPSVSHAPSGVVTSGGVSFSWVGSSGNQTFRDSLGWVISDISRPIEGASSSAGAGSEGAESQAAKTNEKHASTQTVFFTIANLLSDPGRRAVEGCEELTTVPGALLLSAVKNKTGGIKSFFTLFCGFFYTSLVGLYVPALSIPEKTGPLPLCFREDIGYGTPRPDKTKAIETKKGNQKEYTS